MYPSQQLPYVPSTSFDAVVAAAGVAQPPPPPQTPAAEALEAMLARLVAAVQPTPAAARRRARVTAFMLDTIRAVLGAEAYATGSTATSTYLPSSDIDIAVFMPPGQAAGDWFIRLNEALCLASAAVPGSGSGGGGGGGLPPVVAAMAAAAGTPLPPVPGGASGEPLTVRNVTFINADVRVVRCTVDAISVDVSVNSTGALAAAALIESADRWVGHNHLFKRALLLVKAWAELDSAELTTGGTSVVGSDKGLLSSYALSVLLLSAFNTAPAPITTLTAALTAFFEEYGAMSEASDARAGGSAAVTWGNTRLSLFGPQHWYVPAASTPALARPAAPRYIPPSYLRALRRFAAGSVYGAQLPAAAAAAAAAALSAASASAVPGPTAAASGAAAGGGGASARGAGGAAASSSGAAAAGGGGTASRHAPMLDRDFPPDIRNINIVDPVAHWNNLGRSVSRKGVVAVSEALVAGRARWRAVLATAAGAVAPATTSSGGGGDVGAAANAAMATMFPLTASWYGRGDGWREDELVHPLAGGARLPPVRRAAAARAATATGAGRRPWRRRCRCRAHQRRRAPQLCAVVRADGAVAGRDARPPGAAVGAAAGGARLHGGGRAG